MHVPFTQRRALISEIAGGRDSATSAATSGRSPVRPGALAAAPAQEASAAAGRREMMQVNVKSALYGMQAIVPHFQERNAGHLINVSSFLGRVPLSTYRSAYSAAKAALNALTANLRMDLRRTLPGVRVSLVMPGIVRTEFPRNSLGGTPEALWNAAANAGAQTVEEVAAAIAALIAEPRAELYTNRSSAGIAKKYFEDVEAFEAGMGR